MTELSFSGVHDNGTQVILTDSEGNEYLLPISDELRAAVRRDREMVERLRASGEPATPRTIQAMLRAGATVDEVAAATELSRDRVERYESPVLAERAWVVQQSQNLSVGRHPDSPSLGDLVVDRLATRKVEPESLAWTARRAETGPWTLVLEFPVAGQLSSATWEVDLSARSLHATNDEARWLSETDASSPRARLDGIFPMPSRDTQVRETPVAQTETGQEDPTDSLLSSLAQSRGVRQQIEFGDDPDLLDELGEEDEQVSEDVEPAPVLELRRRDTETETPEIPDDHEEAPEDTTQERPEDDEKEEVEEKPARKPARRSSRRSVPSWDEIVFGSKSD